jgi:hypothetical protein
MMPYFDWNIPSTSRGWATFSLISRLLFKSA